MHWADKDSLSLLETLVDDNYPDRMLLFVGASRPVGKEDPNSDVWKLTESMFSRKKLRIMGVSRLSTDEIMELASGLFENKAEQPSNGNMSELAIFIREKTLMMILNCSISHLMKN